MFGRKVAAAQRLPPARAAPGQLPPSNRSEPNTNAPPQREQHTHNAHNNTSSQPKRTSTRGHDVGGSQKRAAYNSGHVAAGAHREYEQCDSRGKGGKAGESKAAPVTRVSGGGKSSGGAGEHAPSVGKVAASLELLMWIADC